eukprot:2743175-Rhodomonas_salina.1
MPSRSDPAASRAATPRKSAAVLVACLTALIGVRDKRVSVLEDSVCALETAVPLALEPRDTCLSVAEPARDRGQPGPGWQS